MQKRSLAELLTGAIVLAVAVVFLAYAVTGSGRSLTGTGIALTAQNAGADVLGYTTQGRFLINCGLLAHLENASLPERAHAQKLIFEHEMGELFKVIAIGKNCSENCELDLLGFTSGDRSHTL